MSTQLRLDALRGSGVIAKPHNARTIAALTRNPGCTRRAVMDAAGVDKDKTAAATGHPASIGKLSPLAVARGQGFEARVKSQGGAELLRLLRENLGLPIPQAHYLDLGGDDDSVIGGRYLRSRSALAASADSGPDAGTLFDHPMLRLQIAGVWVYLEPDMVAFRLEDKFYIIEIKSFAIVDGVADPGDVTRAAIQSSVYVLALRNLLADAGHDPNLVADQVILVCPKDFSNQPTAHFVDVRKQLTVLRRQLARMADIDRLLDSLPDGVTFDLAPDAHGLPTRSAADLAHALRSVEARYAPECLSACELALFCRHDAHDAHSTAALGRTVREELGGVDCTSTAVALGTGTLVPTDDLVQAAETLRAAHALRTAILGQLA
ncbi:hypothetical protein Rhe02_05910 [Rhizocola hellebori]|uniref:Secreted protein n=1 Tax=Rhizocola hellebori TaxID=1392758 RepID=A0A8J3Q2Z5_9ACTN|nr:hypothetical protein [Rhizocola hellebori]GIH02524.1 hypothetical protein Rhe02_05910 [Rhizocola hellebori]